MMAVKQTPNIVQRVSLLPSIPHQLRIPANVTAHSGHRDRFAHQCSLVGVFLH
jgi:hypothetical protein